MHRSASSRACGWRRCSPTACSIPIITRYVGMAYMDAGEAVAAQNRIAAAQPNVVTVRTAMLLDEARAIPMGRRGPERGRRVTLLASLLVLVSVVAASRVRQIYPQRCCTRWGAGRCDPYPLYLEYLLALVTTYSLQLRSAVRWQGCCCTTAWGSTPRWAGGSAAWWRRS